MTYETQPPTITILARWPRRGYRVWLYTPQEVFSRVRPTATEIFPARSVAATIPPIVIVPGQCVRLAS